MIIKFHSEAQKELFDSSEFYENQGVGLGDEFIDEIEKVLSVIEQHPSSGTKITNKERRFLVPRFPFGIIYAVDDEQIIIYAIMSLKRKPGYWKSRT